MLTFFTHILGLTLALNADLGVESGQKLSPGRRLGIQLQRKRQQQSISSPSVVCLFVGERPIFFLGLVLFHLYFKESGWDTSTHPASLPQEVYLQTQAVGAFLAWSTTQ